MFAKLLKRRARSDDEIAARIALKERVATRLRLGDEDAVTISEIVCHDPGCPGVETVILLMRPRQPSRAYKIAAALADVSEGDIEAACTALIGP